MFCIVISSFIYQSNCFPACFSVILSLCQMANAWLVFPFWLSDFLVSVRLSRFISVCLYVSTLNLMVTSLPSALLTLLAFLASYWRWRRCLAIHGCSHCPWMGQKSIRMFSKCYIKSKRKLNVQCCFSNWI